MADAVGLLASAIVTQVGEKLGSVIVDQVTMFCSFKDDMEDMKEMLESMGAALKDAGRRSVREESVKLWLKRLKNAAYHISDMLDQFQDESKHSVGKMPGMLSCFPISCKKIVLANRMRKMREELRRIDEKHKSFNFTRSTNTSIDDQQHFYDQRRRTSSEVNEAEIVGRDEEKQAIIGMLSASANKEETVILPIYGLGGMGKTTVAGLVYNDTQFKKYDNRVWVYVSQVFDLEKIGRSIISQLQKTGIQQNTDMQLINQSLDDLLPDKKILIVLDDIWEENDFELDKLKQMLRVGKKGIRIDVIVTTRNEDIARKICTKEQYKLQPLQDDMCWSIIKRFSQLECRSNKEQFERIGQEIAKKCGGVALAAQALGYTLKAKDLHGWSEVNNSDIWKESPEDEHSPHSAVLPSLKLSFESMPPRLRLCFSYCAILPKGYDIIEDDLIYQWIALDFIKPSRGKEYTKQLFGMSFLRHSKLPSAGIAAKDVVRYTMHNLVHDLARSVVGDELHELVDAAKRNTMEQKYCRYVLLKNNEMPVKLSNILPTKVRAIHCSNGNKTQLPGCSSISKLPESFGDLKSMVHLDMSGCSEIKELPESLGNLKILQHLELSECYSIRVLPESLCGLTQLQYLNLSYCCRLVRLPEAIGSLVDLQYLNMSGCTDIIELPESFKKLQNLLHLDLGNCIEIASLTNLEHLDLSDNMKLQYLPEGIGNLKRLHTLNLSGCERLKCLPESISAISTLKSLLMEGYSNEVIDQVYSRLHYSLTLPLFKVGADDLRGCSNLHLLEGVNVGELTIRCLENTKFVEEACKVKLREKQNLSNLTLSWTLEADRFVEDKNLLGQLVPPRGLGHLYLEGYSSTGFLSWLMGISHHLPNLVHISLEYLPKCSSLPPLGQLSNLKGLRLSMLPSITKIDKDFCGGKGAFCQLSTFVLGGMEGLEEWSTTYCGEDGVEELMFPMLDRLRIMYCPRLRLKPCPPTFLECSISKSDQVISSLGEEDTFGHFSYSSRSTKLEVRYSECQSMKMLGHFPTLEELEFFECELMSLPESLLHLSSLRSLTLSCCDNISALPEWLGDLSSLRSLMIYDCPVKSLPASIQQLTNLQKLHVWFNPELIKWCQSEENKKKLAHINAKVSSVPKHSILSKFLPHFLVRN
ncbi:unnamed protein product [Urochloa decumbens]|uniref:Uncharacterized protein n=1 Tax=Urochloa decumbens TaxID=240449 RepID=A0ABC9BBE5_9POAL